jgi:anti-anti-sigma regulatory factor
MPPSIFVGLNENLRRLFEITHLDEVWPIYATLAEAQKHLP